MKLAKLPELEQSADDCGADDDCRGGWRWQLVLYYFVVFLLLAYHQYKCSYYSCCCYYDYDKYSHNDGDSARTSPTILKGLQTASEHHKSTELPIGSPDIILLRRVSLALRAAFCCFCHLLDKPWASTHAMHCAQFQHLTRPFFVGHSSRSQLKLASFIKFECEL